MHRITLLAPLAGLALAACGAAGNAATTNSDTSAAAAHQSAVAFSRCMRANGVPSFPDPQGGGLKVQASQTSGSGKTLSINGVPANSPAFQAAQAKCMKYAPHGGRLSAADVAKLKAAGLAMARCMRANGVPNFPDPQVRTGPGGFGIGIEIGGGPGSGVDHNSPAFRAAQAKCGSLLRKDLPGPTGPNTSTSAGG